MSDKSPKSKRKNDAQKQAKADAVERVRRKADDDRQANNSKNLPAGKPGKRR